MRLSTEKESFRLIQFCQIRWPEQIVQSRAIGGLKSDEHLSILIPPVLHIFPVSESLISVYQEARKINRNFEGTVSKKGKESIRVIYQNAHFVKLEYIWVLLSRKVNCVDVTNNEEAAEGH